MTIRDIVRPLVLGLAISAGASPAAAEDFGAEVDELFAGLEPALASEEKLDALDERSDGLEDRIRDHRRAHRKELTDEQRDALEALDDDLDALQGTIRVLGQLHNSANVSIEDFERVRARLGLEVETLREASPDLAIVEVKVGAFRSLLVRNATAKSYTVQYAYRTPSMERDQGGVGSSLCKTLTVLSSKLNSRDHELTGLEITTFGARDMGRLGASLGKCD